MATKAEMAELDQMEAGSNHPSLEAVGYNINRVEEGRRDVGTPISIESVRAVAVQSLVRRSGSERDPSIIFIILLCTVVIVTAAFPCLGEGGAVESNAEQMDYCCGFQFNNGQGQVGRNRLPLWCADAFWLDAG
ncbi:hypothetical protein GHT06_021374 [Daphnia sinensis]|uniref:Uncharacterized protein n=1 Tax=Daphnia sinensis TaxID=1820382 RepID=A0AAD5KJP1_9CRUS|nr:hypothetical protein GHT06_021374 [Daphnia sinensis]